VSLPSPPASAHFTAAVDHDPADPRPPSAGVPKPVGMYQRFRNRVMGDFLCVVPVPNEPVGQSHQPLAEISGHRGRSLLGGHPRGFSGHDGAQRVSPLSGTGFTATVGAWHLTGCASGGKCLAGLFNSRPFTHGICTPGTDSQLLNGNSKQAIFAQYAGCSRIRAEYPGVAGPHDSFSPTQPSCPRSTMPP